MQKDSQAHQVKRIMEKNGGIATLGFLYQNVDTSSWATKTPFASIRRIVQVNKEFFRIKPGLWGLTKEKGRFIDEYDLSTNKSEKAEIFNHTYYQGLIVELGNLYGYATYIPNQDKNRLYLSKPLQDVASLNSIYTFSHAEIVNKAKSIDVIWFNIRKMPSTFFEVEHSTDIFTSLIKFVELQDFNSKFKIVADYVRKREFDQKLSRTAFSEIKQHVEFISYEDLSELHTDASKHIAKQKMLNLR